MTEAEVKTTTPLQFRLRTIFILVTVVACILGALVFAQSVINFVELDHARKLYLDGRITREQARDRFGKAVDDWPTPVKSPN